MGPRSGLPSKARVPSKARTVIHHPYITLGASDVTDTKGDFTPVGPSSLPWGEFFVRKSVDVFFLLLLDSIPGIIKRAPPTGPYG